MSINRLDHEPTRDCSHTLGGGWTGNPDPPRFRYVQQTPLQDPFRDELFTIKNRSCNQKLQPLTNFSFFSFLVIGVFY